MFAVARAPTTLRSNPTPEKPLLRIGQNETDANKDLIAPNVVLFGDARKVCIGYAYSDVVDSIKVLYGGECGDLGKQLRSFCQHHTLDGNVEFQTTKNWLPFLRHHYSDKLEWPALNELFKIKLDAFRPDGGNFDIPDTALWYCLAHLSSLFFHSQGEGGLRPWVSNLPFAENLPFDGNAYRAGWAYVLHPLGKAISDLAKRGAKNNASFLIECLNCLQLIEVFKDLSFDLNIQATRQALSEKDRADNTDLSGGVNAIDLFDETKQHLTRFLRSSSVSPTTSNELKVVLCNIETLLTNAMCFTTIQYAFGGSNAELTIEKSAVLGLLGATMSSIVDSSCRIEQETDEIQRYFTGTKDFGQILEGITTSCTFIVNIVANIGVAEEYLLSCKLGVLQEAERDQMVGLLETICSFAHISVQNNISRPNQQAQLDRIKLAAICFGVDTLVMAVQACFNNIASGRNEQVNWRVQQKFGELHAILTCELNRLGHIQMESRARQLQDCLNKLSNVVTRFFADVSSMAVVLSVRDLVDITGQVWSLFKDPALKQNIRTALSSVSISDFEFQAEAERKSLEANTTLALRNITKGLIGRAAKAAEQRRLVTFDPSQSIAPASTWLQILGSNTNRRFIPPADHPTGKSTSGSDKLLTDVREPIDPPSEIEFPPEIDDEALIPGSSPSNTDDINSAATLTESDVESSSSGVKVDAKSSPKNQTVSRQPTLRLEKREVELENLITTFSKEQGRLLTSHVVLKTDLAAEENASRRVEHQKFAIQKYINEIAFNDVNERLIINNLDAYSYFDTHDGIKLTDARFGGNKKEQSWYASFHEAVRKINDTDRLCIERRLKNYIACQNATDTPHKRSDIEYICKVSGITFQKTNWWSSFLQKMVSVLSFDHIYYTPSPNLLYTKSKVVPYKPIALHTTPYSQVQTEIARLKTAAESTGKKIKTLEDRIAEAERELKIVTETLNRARLANQKPSLSSGASPVSAPIQNQAITRVMPKRLESKSFWGDRTAFKFGAINWDNLNFIPTRENTLIGKRRMDKPFGIGPLPEPELSRLPDELDSLVIPLADKSDVSGSYSYNTGISRKFLDMLHRGLDFDSTAVAEFEQQVETFAGKLRGTPSGNLKEKNDVNNFKKVIFPQWVDAILRYASSGKSVHQAVLRDRLQLIVDRHKAN